MLKAQWCRYRLDFRFVARTSRETMLFKDTYFIRVFHSAAPEVCGLGEVALFRGLSADDTPDFETALARACQLPDGVLPPMSAIRFGFETALADLAAGGTRCFWPSQWDEGRYGIQTNGLVWMGDKPTMLARVEEKLEQGFGVLKLKIGGIDFDDEVDIISSVRRRFSRDVLEIRLDANGSFTCDNALERLDRLSRFGIHSLEQPIMAGQPEAMGRICRQSPVPVALDEELIGCRDRSDIDALLSEVRPAYIILKPSLCGGFAAADDWIDAATRLGLGWWATSALESNIGLNAIARWVALKNPAMPQGLGTGALYHNNISSPLQMKGDRLYYSSSMRWTLPDLQWRQ